MSRAAAPRAAAPALFADDAVPLAALKARAHNLRWAAQPDGVIPLTAADPDFLAPPCVREALCRYVQGGPLSYGPAEGLPSFREAVAGRLRARGAPSADAARVLACDGAASALHLAARALLRPGDEVLIPDPVDFLFERAAVSAGARPVRVPYRRGAGLDLEALAAAVTPRTRALWLCAPHNPYGQLLSAAEVRAAAALAHAHDLWLLSDEVWSEITYEAPQAPTAADPDAAPRTVTVGGFSKTYGLAGLRVGYLHAPNDATFARLLAASEAPYTAYGAATLSQVAAEAGLREGEGWLRAFLDHLRAQRDHAACRLGALPGLRCDRPQATYLLSPYVVRGLLEDPLLARHTSDSLAASILAEARVALVPGSPRFFGAGAEGLVRLSFATSRGLLDEALGRIEGAWGRVLGRGGAP